MNLPPNVPSSICVLYVFARDGGLAAYWYHPNHEALEPKRKELEELENFRVELVRYVIVSGEA